MVLILDSYQRALALLASQFRGVKEDGELTNLQKLIRAIVTPVQELQDVNYELETERWLSSAVGQQLDEIGIILGLPRNLDESDSDYRERLQFQIFINTSSGTPEEIIRILKTLTNATFIGYLDSPYAFFQLETNGLTFPDPPNDLNDAIFKASPAGVNYAPIVATYNVPISFQFGNDVSSNPFGVAPNLSDIEEITLLEIEPTPSILYVSAGTIANDNPEGGLAELDFPSPLAGKLSELIQKSGNFPATR